MVNDLTLIYRKDMTLARKMFVDYTFSKKLRFQKLIGLRLERYEG